MGLLRLLEIVFFLYFATHIPITILFDSQVVASDFNIPKSVYPQVCLDLVKQYVAEFKDPYLMNPPNWYKSFVLFEVIVQFPYFIVGCAAMLLGSRPWIRTSLIIYSSHVATTVVPMLYSFAFDDFVKMKRVGPVTPEERIKLIAVYTPYLVIPLLMILTMLMSNSYTCAKAATRESKATTSPKKKHHKAH